MKRNSAGFTIIELMIATAVFSILLLLCLQAVLRISTIYYKGVTTARTQDATRSVIDEIARAIQFSQDPISQPSASTGSMQAICIGSLRYRYRTGRQLSSKKDSTHAESILTRDAIVSGCGDALQTGNDTKPVELLTEGMRLNRLQITALDANGLEIPITNPTAWSVAPLWRVSVSVAYGDDDLFYKENDGTTNYEKCAPGAVTGSQFCAASKLDTIVQRRLQQ